GANQASGQISTYAVGSSGVGGGEGHWNGGRRVPPLQYRKARLESSTSRVRSPELHGPEVQSPRVPESQSPRAQTGGAAAAGGWAGLGLGWVRWGRVGRGGMTVMPVPLRRIYAGKTPS